MLTFNSVLGAAADELRHDRAVRGMIGYSILIGRRALFVRARRGQYVGG